MLDCELSSQLWSKMWLHRLCLALCLLLPAPRTAAKGKAAPRILQEVNKCCPLPLPNWGAFGRECSHAGADNTCLLQCIFNSTDALQGQKLSLPHVRPMLERAFSDPDIIDAYVANFARCGPLVRGRYQALTQISRQKGSCDRHALFYSLCAYSRLMGRCPPKAWQRNNKECRAARAYMKNNTWPALEKFMKST